ncbi:hypothetical protein AVEN_201328-1 [Araneus ventricosus]|uniref:Uncharacterized protein n=1 Tax=Araneus ventricosus TaxID=182803 RepID=A0A4Y2V4B9_ARAVE|nr:hypothetical protein AVEN_201328-1 [Araneus ventricosus]
MLAAADLTEIILHLSGILEAIEKIWSVPPPLSPPFPFYPHRSASPSSTAPSVSMDHMMGSEPVKFKDDLPSELKPEYERHLFECFTQNDPAACAQNLMHEFQKKNCCSRTKGL